MRTAIVTAVFLCIVVQTSAAEIELLNVDTLEKHVSENIQFLSKGSENAIYPGHVGFDLHKDKISIVTLIYHADLGFAALRRAINHSYGEYAQPDQGSKNNPLAIRHLPNKVEIQMQTNELGHIQVVYLTNKAFEW